jgi:hypothetical protein
MRAGSEEAVQKYYSFAYEDQVFDEFLRVPGESM